MDDAKLSARLYFGPWYRRSPFFEKTLAAGCSAYDIYNHMYLPGYYADPVEEYWAPAQRRDAVGRGASSGSSRSPGRTRSELHQHAHLPRPDQVRRRPGQVRA